MKQKIFYTLMWGGLALLAGCLASSNPVSAPNLVRALPPTATFTIGSPTNTPTITYTFTKTSTPTRTFTPTFTNTATNTPTSTFTACPMLGASGNPSGGGDVVSGASGPTTTNSYFSEGFTLSNTLSVKSFQAILANSGSLPETFYGAIYDGSNNLVSGSGVTLVVPAGSGAFNFNWQTYDYGSSIPLSTGNYTLFGYITTGTEVALGWSNYSGGCQFGAGLTTNLSTFPSSINGNSPSTNTNSLGMLVSGCP